MPGTLAPSIPTIGQPNSTEDSDVRESLITIRNGLNAVLNSSNGIDYPYRTLIFGHALTGSTAGDNIPSLLSYNASGLVPSGSIISNGINLAQSYLDEADHAVANKTAKLRIRAQVITNNTSPGLMKWTFALYPVSFSSGAGNTVVVTMNPLVGNTAVIENPGTAKVTNANSSLFSVPTTGMYALGVACSGLPAGRQILHAELHVVNQ
jgi:hypothetical protein